MGQSIAASTMMQQIQGKAGTMPGSAPLDTTGTNVPDALALQELSPALEPWGTRGGNRWLLPGCTRNMNGSG